MRERDPATGYDRELRVVSRRCVGEREHVICEILTPPRVGEWISWVVRPDGSVGGYSETASLQSAFDRRDDWERDERRRLRC